MGSALNANVSKNQHRWKMSLDDHTLGVLEEAAEVLEWVWKLDKEYPGSYPMNTDLVLGETKERLRGQSHARTVHEVPPPQPLPQSLSELLCEKTISAVYELQNKGTYKEALKQAALGFENGASTWRKIWLAVNTAYLIDHLGVEFVPKPRIHFLHRSLLEVANLAQLSDLTHEGIAEFFDDLCPCGKGHKPDAIRKLRRRRQAGSRTAP